MAYNPYLMKCSPMRGVCFAWQYWDFTTEKCISRCQVNHTYYPNNDSCQCYPSAPYFNTSSRLCEVPPCNSTSRWNAYLQICELANGNCHSWQWYNFTSDQCVTMCVVNQTYFPNNHTCSCNASYPYFNSTSFQCQAPACPYNTVWNPYFYRC